MPSPEELGLTAAVPASDWTAAHRRLQTLGATGLQLDPLTAGGWRVSFGLSTGKSNEHQRVTAQAASPEAAVHLALQEADARRVEARK